MEEPKDHFNVSFIVSAIPKPNLSLPLKATTNVKTPSTPDGRI